MYKSYNINQINDSKRFKVDSFIQIISGEMKSTKYYCTTYQAV